MNFIDSIMYQGSEMLFAFRCDIIIIMPMIHFDLCLWKISLNKAVCGVHFSDRRVSTALGDSIGNGTKLSNATDIYCPLHQKKMVNEEESREGAEY